MTTDVWSADEDVLLKSIVEIQGPRNWTEISYRIPGRNPKQCRERWYYHLDHGVKKGVWTEEEDEIILSKQEQYGNQWSQFARLLHGRTDNDIKNRYHSLRRAMSKHCNTVKVIDYKQVTIANLEALRLQRSQEMKELDERPSKLSRCDFQSISTSFSDSDGSDHMRDSFSSSKSSECIFGTFSTDDPVEQEILDFLASDEFERRARIDDSYQTTYTANQPLTRIVSASY